MACNCTDSNLVDDLVPCIDELRKDLHQGMGTRPYEVCFIRRKWNGCVVGDGQYTDTVLEACPRPHVHPFSSLKYQQEPCGLDEAGYVKVTEVSLSYTFHDIVACEADEGVEHLIKIQSDATHGGPPRYFVHARPPYIDKEKTFGWVLYLEHVETGDCPEESS